MLSEIADVNNELTDFEKNLNSLFPFLDITDKLFSVQDPQGSHSKNTQKMNEANKKIQL